MAGCSSRRSSRGRSACCAIRTATAARRISMTTPAECSRIAWRCSPSRFYGYPNPAQPEHAKKAAGKAAVWVPYGWAHSLNGVTCDTTGGKFGPFAGQFFIAELVFGGAIIRADLEKVNGEYQGACFP